MVRTLILVTALLLSAPVLAGEASHLDRFKLWNKCRPMGLTVDVRSDEETDISPIEKDIVFSARNRLRAAQLYTEDFEQAAGAYLHIQLDAAQNPALMILPPRIGPPLGYGKRRTDDGQEALQA